MKNYVILRCVLGMLGSIVAIVLGAVFLVEGIKYSETKGLLIGIPVIIAGLVGIFICIALLKKANKSDNNKNE